MQSGGKKFIKPERTRNRRMEDENERIRPLKPKQKQKDKSFRRLLKEEKDYVI